MASEEPGKKGVRFRSRLAAMPALGGRGFAAQILVPRGGVEPPTQGIYKSQSFAREGIMSRTDRKLVPRGGVEPPTQGFSILRSTAELPRHVAILLHPANTRPGGSSSGYADCSFSPNGSLR